MKCAQIGTLSPQNVEVSNAPGRQWMLLVPKGRTSGRDGRGPFDAGDEAAMQAIIERTKAIAGATELMVDYDHQSVFSAVPGVGGNAKAAGWIKDYRITDRGIEGAVEWTAAARTAIRASEYRYLSPVFRHDSEGRVLTLHSVGLVNTPNYDLEAVAASASLSSKGKTMLDKIAKALGLAETATEDEIVAAIAKLTKDGDPDPAKFVPMSAFQDVMVQLNSTRSGYSQKEAEREVEHQISLGRVPPSAKDWAVNLVQTNKEAYDSFLTKISPMAFGAGGVLAPQLGERRHHEPRNSSLGDEVASKLGLSADDLKKYGRS